MRIIEGWFDGVCEPRNPGGHGAWGGLVRIDGVDVFKQGGYCGRGPEISNNVAEFTGFIEVLKEIGKHQGAAIIRGDSKLVIFTIQGLWETHGGLYMPFFEQARRLYRAERERLGLEWIPRRENNVCDELSKAVLIEKGIRFRIQPLEGQPSSPFPITPAEAIDDGYTLETSGARCSGCKAVIDWWVTPRGKKIPIDSSKETFQTHFTTCPKVGQFRRKRA